MKRCTECGIEKDLDCFYRCRTSKGGLRHECKKCHNASVVRCRRKHLEKHRTAHRRWLSANREKAKILNKNTRLKRTYGITIENYNELLCKQDGQCAICGKKLLTSKETCIDHNHKTGKIRGFLCIQHNALLGMANDDPKILEQAINYLKSDGIVEGHIAQK
jgi:hypothetical protein